MMKSSEPAIENNRIYRGRVVGLCIDTVELPRSRVSQWEIVEHGGSIIVVPLEGRMNVLLVRQYRKAIE